MGQLLLSLLLDCEGRVWFDEQQHSRTLELAGASSQHDSICKDQVVADLPAFARVDSVCSVKRCILRMKSYYLSLGFPFSFSHDVDSYHVRSADSSVDQLPSSSPWGICFCTLCAWTKFDQV